MSPVAEIVRRHDPDRYFCTLFAPADKRAALFTLYAFNHELARALEVASEPALALIRLQWWREVAEGQAKRHEVASPLHALIEAGVIAREAALALVEARDDSVSAPAETVEGFVAAMRAGPGRLAALAGAVLGASAEEQAVLVGVGAAYGVAGTLRNFAAMARLGRCVVPEAVLMEVGLSREAALADPAAALARLAPGLRAAGVRLAGAARPWRQIVLSAALPGVFARRDLGRAAPVGAHGVGDRLAVLGAVVARRA
jgi:phytoene synthase